MYWRPSRCSRRAAACAARPCRDGAARRARRFRGRGAARRTKWRSAPARRRRAGAAPGPHQRRAGLRQCAVRMALRALADAGDGPAVHRRAPQPPPLPRPAGAGAPARTMPSTAPATKRRCGRATNCSPRTGPIRAWLAALEARMAEHGAAIADARRETVAALAERLAEQPEGAFARAGIALDGERAGDLARRCAAAARAMPPPAARSPARTAPTSPSPMRQGQPAASLFDRRAKGAADRPDPRPCRSRRRAHRAPPDPAARRDRRASRPGPPRRLVRATWQRPAGRSG